MTVFAQKSICNPTEIVMLTDSIIQVIDKDDLTDIRTSKDFWNRPTTYPFNYEDLEFTINYAEIKGCKQFQEGYAKEVVREYVFNKVRNTDACFDKIVKKYIEECCVFSKAKYIEGVYIPKDIEDCIKQLDQLWGNDLKQKFKNKELDGLTEMELGRSLRNNWGLWSRSRLLQYFNNFGISNPDDISAIIFKCYCRHLSNEPIKFAEEIEYSKKLEIITRQPSLKEFPREVRNVRHQKTMYLKPKSEFDTYDAIHFYTDKNEIFYWVYNYKFGWKKITQEQYKESDSVEDIRLWLNATYN